jgi:hypothetical protein
MECPFRSDHPLDKQRVRPGFRREPGVIFVPPGHLHRGDPAPPDLGLFMNHRSENPDRTGVVA